MKTLTNLQTFYPAIKSAATVAASAVWTFVGPVMPYGWLCTAMVAADFISARMLARRAVRRYGKTEAAKFASRRLGATITTLAKVYAFLLLAHGIDVVIVGAESNISVLRFAAALVCFWQLWSILENEASVNNTRWARMAQRILIDKTERHLGVDLKELKHRNKDV